MSELDDLIAEQARDDSRDRVWSLSVDAMPSGADIVRQQPRRLVTDPRHGTLGCYTNLRCRCAKCRAASAAARRERRRRARVEKGPYTYRTCCRDCGSANVQRSRVYEGAP